MRIVKYILLFALAALVTACSGRVITSGNFTLRGGETLNGDLTITSGNADLEVGSRVTGSIFMTSGDLIVGGEVDGDILMTSGDLDLQSDAHVHGDVTITSGDVSRAEGARVDGDVFTEESGFNSNFIGNVFGRLFALPILVIVLVFYFIFRPGQQRKTVNFPAESEQPVDVEEKRKIGEPLMDNETGRVTGAIVLIGLGVAFLLAQTGILSLSGNWWALFIALPAIAMLYNAYTNYQKAGHVTSDVRRNISGAAVVGTVAIIALTGQWGTLWPLFLIVPGVMMLLGFMKGDEPAG